MNMVNVIAIHPRLLKDNNLHTTFFQMLARIVSVVNFAISIAFNQKGLQRENIALIKIQLFFPNYSGAVTAFSAAA